MLLGATGAKAVGKYVGEIDPRSWNFFQKYKIMFKWSNYK
jgi:hypothetical protein